MNHGRSAITLTLLAALGLPFATGCLSVGIESVGRAAPGVETGSLRVSVFQHTPRNGHGDLPEHPFVSELTRIDGPREIAIRETSDSRWSAHDLAPGKYRIRVARFIDAAGKTRELPTRVQETFHVRPGETVSAEIVVKRFPTGTVVGLGAGAVGGILLAAVLSSAFAWRGGSTGSTFNINRKKKEKKLLDTRPIPARQSGSFPSAFLP